MMDWKGDPVFDIFRWISPALYKVFLEQESVMEIWGNDGTHVYEFIYPDESEDLDYD